MRYLIQDQAWFPLLKAKDQFWPLDHTHWFDKFVINHHNRLWERIARVTKTLESQWKRVLTSLICRLSWCSSVLRSLQVVNQPRATPISVNRSIHWLLECLKYDCISSTKCMHCIPQRELTFLHNFPPSYFALTIEKSKGDQPKNLADLERFRSRRN